VYNLNDVELDRNYEEPFEPTPTPNRIGWVIGIGIALAIAGGVAYTLLRDRTPAAPVKATAPAPAATQPATAEPKKLVGENITLPPLAETDSIVRELTGQLSSHPTIAAWLATKGLISNFTVVTLNIAEGQAPTTHLRALTPKGRFRTTGTGSALAVDPKSYDRYNGFGDAVGGLDATGTARLYLTLQPRILDAYRELGYPDGNFDRVLERAFGQLLNAPVLDSAPPLRPKTLSFAFADPRIESLSPAQKQFLRMGPRNVQTVQSKLRDIAALLELHPGS
jgi:Protein of unknown function (DUF3014)